MIPDAIVQAITSAELPCFVYDCVAITHRAAQAASLVDKYFFPVKVCPEPAVLRALVTAGCGLDLCSNGDVELASFTGCPGERWKFTSACADDDLLHKLAQAAATIDADSLEQALTWAACGGTVCGLRIVAKSPKSLYGAKFGIPASESGVVASRLARAGLRVEGFHLHDQHANLTPLDFGSRLAETFADVSPDLLRDCRYINIGGSWPMRHGNPAAVADLQSALLTLREQLTALGFQGALYAEPGRWVVGPCGYWAARVAAMKPHPLGAEHRVVILDTTTPVPCRPSLAPFAVLRDGRVLGEPRTLTCDIFGSANTALDLIGAGVRLPALAPGDVAVSLGQGAYTRSLIPPFNEGDRPAAIVVGA